MAPSSTRRRANNSSNTSRGSATPRRRGGRQGQLPFGRPPVGNDVAPLIPIDLDPTTRRAASEPPTPPQPAPKGRKRWAWIFQHMPSENTEEKYYDNISGKEIWRCGYCAKQYYTNSGTKSAEEHLATHGLNKGDPRGTPVTFSDSTRQQPLASGFKRQFELGEDHQFKRRNIGLTNGQSINPDRLELLYIRFISVCSQPLRLVERSEFRDLLEYINPDTLCWLPRSHTTVAI
ncbi:hypothetical protein ACEPPN_000967 [Leptodophora sp. 'Broadleaf-Isolate-01']